jgi:hypothetical protein
VRAALLLTLIAAACSSRASAPPQPAPTRIVAASGAAGGSALATALAEDMAAERGMPWSATRRLSWSDFQGRPPQTGEEGARTAYGLYYAWSCRGEAFSFHAVAAFHPLRSWVKPIVVGHPGESGRVLRHEQTHFDITEVFARRMRQRFATLASPCARDDAELRRLARELVDAEKETQQRYDRETNHGLLTDRQAGWNADVARMLQAVARYAL